MKFFKENPVNLLISLFELVIGILLLINPVGFTSGIIIALGVLLLVLGIVNIVFYFRKPLAEASQRLYLAKGLLYVSAGLFCIFCSHWFLDTFPLLTFLYGLTLLVSGFFKVQWFIDLLRRKQSRWWLGAIGAATTLVLSVIIVVNPFGATMVIWYFAAISLIAQGFLDLVTLLMIRIFANFAFQRVRKDAEEPVTDKSDKPYPPES